MWKKLSFTFAFESFKCDVSHFWGYVCSFKGIIDSDSVLRTAASKFFSEGLRQKWDDALRKINKQMNDQ